MLKETNTPTRPRIEPGSPDPESDALTIRPVRPPQRKTFELLKGFYHIWAWQPSWSCDQHHVIRFSFPCTKKLTYKIWLKTRFDVYETLCPQQMLVHKGGQIENWSGECRANIPTKLQCQTIQRALQSPNLQREIIGKK